MKLIEHDYPLFEHELNCRMPNGTYSGVRGKETKVGQKTSFPTYSILADTVGKMSLKLLGFLFRESSL